MPDVLIADPEDNLSPKMTEKDLDDLRRAHLLLENPSFIAKAADLLGTPIEKILTYLPDKAGEVISKATHTALHKALKTALWTMEVRDPVLAGQPESSNWWHTAAVAITGGLGGAAGLFGLLVELPVSTTIMMRSIADVARSEGADLREIDVQLACLQVLALGGRSSEDDASEVGYFAVRSAMADAVAAAAKYLAQGGAANAEAPALVRLIVIISERFGIQVTEKVAAQAIPAIGAISGAIINTLFIDHFQDMARGHFIILRLEGKYGKEIVKAEYKRLNK